MTEHMYDVSRAFYPDQLQYCCCGWVERNLLEMKRHLLYPERGMPVELERVVQLEPVVLRACRIESCSRRVYRIGLCHSHFNAWRRREPKVAA